MMAELDTELRRGLRMGDFFLWTAFFLCVEDEGGRVAVNSGDDARDD